MINLENNKFSTELKQTLKLKVLEENQSHGTLK